MKFSVGVVLIKKKQALLQLRDNKPGIVLPGYWSIPGGAVEKGEDIVQAAKREFKEETGYLLKDPKLFTTEVYKMGRKNIKRHIFYEIYDGKQVISCFEGQNMEFKSLQALRKLKMLPDHFDFVEKAIKLADHG